MYQTLPFSFFTLINVRRGTRLPSKEEIFKSWGGKKYQERPIFYNIIFLCIFLAQFVLVCNLSPVRSVGNLIPKLDKKLDIILCTFLAQYALVGSGDSSNLIV